MPHQFVSQTAFQLQIHLLILNPKKKNSSYLFASVVVCSEEVIISDLQIRELSLQFFIFRDGRTAQFLLNEPAQPTITSSSYNAQIQIKEGKKGTYSREEKGLSFCSYKETRTATTVTKQTMVGLIDSNKERKKERIKSKVETYITTFGESVNSST